MQATPKFVKTLVVTSIIMHQYEQARAEYCVVKLGCVFPMRLLQCNILHECVWIEVLGHHLQSLNGFRFTCSARPVSVLTDIV